MRLSSADLTTILTILEKIDRDLIDPRVPDRMGRFLRQYRGGRLRLDQILVDHGVERRADAAVAGRAIGAVELHPLLEPEISVRGFPLGEVADTLAISEEIGGLANVAMWLKSPIANAAYNLLLEKSALRLSGDYRWVPPTRVTTGEAHVAVGERNIPWQDARCLKAVADDLNRPPHALEYVLDYRLGPPGLKYFRSVCAIRRGTEWQALPALGPPRRLDIADPIPRHLSALGRKEPASLLIYREPWSESWTIVAGKAVNADHALAHAITWADFQRELDARDTDGAIVAGIRDSLRALDLRPGDIGEPDLTRKLAPLAKDIQRWLRGVG